MFGLAGAYASGEGDEPSPAFSEAPLKGEGDALPTDAPTSDILESPLSGSMIGSEDEVAPLAGVTPPEPLGAPGDYATRDYEYRDAGSMRSRDDLDCSAAAFYHLPQNGQIYQLKDGVRSYIGRMKEPNNNPAYPNETGTYTGWIQGTVTNHPNSANYFNHTDNWRANGIDIGYMGKDIWAYWRQTININGENYQSSAYIMHAKRNSDAPGSGWTWTQEAFMVTGEKLDLIAGGLNKKTGEFVTGGYVVRNKGLENETATLELYGYSPTTGQQRYIGYIDFGTKPLSNQYGLRLVNGDLTFDNAGNLYAVLGSGSQVTIAAVAQKDFDAATYDKNSTDPDNGRINRTVARHFNADGIEDINGIAFDTNGDLVLTSMTKALRYNPVTGDTVKVENGDIGSYLNDGTNVPEMGVIGSDFYYNMDLGSCTSPSTLTVRKNIEDGRVYSKDQFTLNMELANITGQQIPFAEVTTNGTGSGIQDFQVGPMPIHSDPAPGGTAYRVMEKIADGSVSTLNKYDAWLECVDTNKLDDQGNPTVLLEKTKWNPTSAPTQAFSDVTVTAPGATDTMGPQVVCTITNKPRAHMKLTKTDSTSGELQPGVTFELWKDLNGNGRIDEGVDEKITLSDGTQTQTSFTTNDDGVIEWKDLYWGTYLIKETGIPTGYEYMNPNPASVTVGSTVTLDSSVSASDDDITATIDVENPRKTGSIEFFKEDDANHALAGSVWRLTRTDAPLSDPNRVRTINDCVATDSTQCTGADTNQDAGHFVVKNLEWGSYTLEETAAPVGYVLDADNTKTFTIDAQKLNHTFSVPFVNEQQTPPALPHTGGMSAMTYIVAGLLLLAASGIGMRMNATTRRGRHAA